MRLLALLLAPALVAATFTPAHAHSRPLADWLDDRSVALTTTDPAAPLDDLAHLRRSVRGATVVGLGEAAHNLAEITRLKHRAARHLVEERGFRTIAWEEDWTLGTRIDTYLRTGEGDLRALIAQMSTGWRSEEVAEVLTWLRSYNATHRDQVRFLGVEGFATRPLAAEAIEAHVARVAPERLAEAKAHTAVVKPFTENMKEYLDWYRRVEDKQPYVRHASALRALVESLPDNDVIGQHTLVESPPDNDVIGQHTLVESPPDNDVIGQHARAIESFYVRFTLGLAENLSHRDAFAAETLRWWQRRTGDRVVYWAASAHTAVAPTLRATHPPLDVSFPSAGSHLKRWYGPRYRSIGFTFDRGTGVGEDGGHVVLPRPALVRGPVGLRHRQHLHPRPERPPVPTRPRLAVRPHAHPKPGRRRARRATIRRHPRRMVRRPRAHPSGHPRTTAPPERPIARRRTSPGPLIPRCGDLAELIAGKVARHPTSAVHPCRVGGVANESGEGDVGEVLSDVMRRTLYQLFRSRSSRTISWIRAGSSVMRPR